MDNLLISVRQFNNYVLHSLGLKIDYAKEKECRECKFRASEKQAGMCDKCLLRQTEKYQDILFI